MQLKSQLYRENQTTQVTGALDFIESTSEDFVGVAAIL